MCETLSNTHRKGLLPGRLNYHTQTVQAARGLQCRRWMSLSSEQTFWSPRSWCRGHPDLWRGKLFPKQWGTEPAIPSNHITIPKEDPWQWWGYLLHIGEPDNDHLKKSGAAHWVFVGSASGEYQPALRTDRAIEEIGEGSSWLIPAQGYSILIL